MSGAPRGPVGFLDALRDGVLSGWARDPADPAAVATIRVMRGMQVLAEAPADLPQAEGLPGFRIAIGAALLPEDLLEGRVRVRAVLPGRPAAVTLAMSAQMRADLEAAAGWEPTTAVPPSPPAAEPPPVPPPPVPPPPVPLPPAPPPLPSWAVPLEELPAPPAWAVAPAPAAAPAPPAWAAPLEIPPPPIASPPGWAAAPEPAPLVGEPAALPSADPGPVPLLGLLEPAPATEPPEPEPDPELDAAVAAALRAGRLEDLSRACAAAGIAALHLALPRPGAAEAMAALEAAALARPAVATAWVGPPEPRRPEAVPAARAGLMLLHALLGELRRRRPEDHAALDAALAIAARARPPGTPAAAFSGQTLPRRIATRPGAEAWSCAGAPLPWRVVLLAAPGQGLGAGPPALGWWLRRLAAETVLSEALDAAPAAALLGLRPDLLVTLSVPEPAEVETLRAG